MKKNYIQPKMAIANMCKEDIMEIAPMSLRDAADPSSFEFRSPQMQDDDDFFLLDQDKKSASPWSMWK